MIEPRDVILQVTGSTVCGSDLHLLHGKLDRLTLGGSQFPNLTVHQDPWWKCKRVISLGTSSAEESSNGVLKSQSSRRATAWLHLSRSPAESACTASRSYRVNASGQTTTQLRMPCTVDELLVCLLQRQLFDVPSSIDGLRILTRLKGMFGYSHFTGGFAGGQAEYVRVPFGDVNLLPLPDSVPDEKGLYLSDVLCTSWNCVVDTGVKEGDVVAIWGAGPIGQMAAEMSFTNGAKRVILIDGGPAAWRLDFVKEKIPKIETLNFSTLPKGQSVTSMLKEMEHGGPDVALECVAGEYAKGWAHYFEMLLGAETDTSEILNEMITSVKSYGRCGITGVYVGYVRLSRRP